MAAKVRRESAPRNDRALLARGDLEGMAGCREASADWPGEVRHVMGSRMDTVPVVVISGSW
ncbi:hypothetical protein CSB94_6489 [Pseudomonas aeruginosa]|nr:hypothetical protein CSB94_6489 [Pseudomonas aeruginosa]